MCYPPIPESFFLHSELEDALKVLPTGIWDRYHLSGIPPQPKRAKGYGQYQFEAELTHAKQVYAEASEKAKTCPVDLSNLVHVVDSLFYKINLVLLEYKINHLSEQHCAVLEEEAQVSLADYFLHQQTKVSI